MPEDNLQRAHDVIAALETAATADLFGRGG